MEHNIDQDISCEQDDDLEDDQEEDGDDRDTFDMWDIMIGDIERIRQFLTLNVPEVIKDVIHPLIPKTLHTTPPNEDYVASTTKSILDEELEKLLANDPKPHNLEIQVNSIIINPKPFIHTEPMNPLYGIFESYMSLTKSYEADRETKSLFWYGLKLPFPYPVANEHPNDVYCYFHPHLIPSEGAYTLLASK
nr:hypothetical protein [Tanacetum cinerariifolium]